VTTTPRVGLVAGALLVLVRLYRRLTAHRPSPCRYDPTCSGYALEAIERHGAARGSWLTVRRLCRCHPWGGQGWDPVPPTTSQVKV
jgi:uncharacterized protein